MDLQVPSATDLTGDALAAAYPWPRDRRWVRAVMARTLDGGVTGADGRSLSISSDVDRAVLGEIRRLSDAIVVGASTVRLEPYGPMAARADAVAERVELGLAPAPVIVIVSGSLDLPWDAPMFAESQQRPIVVTTGSAPEPAVQSAREHSQLVILDGDSVEGPALLDALEARGLRRVVVEGGPGLLASLAHEGVVDEVDLTVSPWFGAPPTRSAGQGAAMPAALSRLELRHVLQADGFLFTRYVRP